jgi:hypothetical protein
MQQAASQRRLLPTIPNQQPALSATNQTSNPQSNPSNTNNFTVEQRSRAGSRALPTIPTHPPTPQDLLPHVGKVSEPLPENNVLIVGQITNSNVEFDAWIPFLPKPSWLASAQPDSTPKSSAPLDSESTNQANSLPQQRQNLDKLTATELLELFRQCQNNEEFCSLCDDLLLTKQLVNLDKKFIEGLLRIFPQCETNDVVRKLVEVVLHVAQFVKLDAPVSVVLLKIFPMCHTDETVQTLCELVLSAIQAESLDAQHHVFYKLEEMACGYVLSGHIDFAKIVFAKLNTELPTDLHVQDLVTNYKSNFEKNFHVVLKVECPRGREEGKELNSRISAYREMAQQFLLFERSEYASVIYDQLMSRDLNVKKAKQSVLSVNDKNKIDRFGTNNNASLVEAHHKTTIPQRPRNNTPSIQQTLSLCATKEQVESRCSFLLNQVAQQDTQKLLPILCELEKTACQWMLSSNKQHLAKTVFNSLSTYLSSEQLTQSMVNECKEAIRLNCSTILGKVKTYLPEESLITLVQEFKLTAQWFLNWGRSEYSRIICEQLAAHGYIDEKEMDRLGFS